MSATPERQARRAQMEFDLRAANRSAGVLLSKGSRLGEDRVAKAVSTGQMRDEIRGLRRRWGLDRG